MKHFIKSLASRTLLTTLHQVAIRLQTYANIFIIFNPEFLLQKFVQLLEASAILNVDAY